ncbi:Ribonuclease H2 subunit A [Hypsibius exemplaris]|uniref:Ribonuclease n=1 Tax=Hypsibius exemplaris TaxID=2072580 RepID=A0A1W0W9N7_HYPEX|nr:Ribonuclease H2 subunit A [Hypsibius exemplaris]
MDLEKFHLDNGQDYIIKSAIPPEIGCNEVLIGIDEAGRGPVLGPMVYGACYVSRKDEPLLTTLKVADSKTLTEEQRDGCFSNLQNGRDTFGWIAQILPPASISRGMLSRCKYNLNAISHDSAMLLIQSILDMGVTVGAVFLDTVGDPGKYEAKLKERFPLIPAITVSKKADSLFPVVSAASIVAKVCRDQALKEWRFLEGDRFHREIKYGSGYPADPMTKKFLEEHCDRVFGYPQLIRFSWSTTEKAMEAAAVPVRWEKILTEEEASATASTQQITKFFRKRARVEDEAPMEPATVSRHRFFSERNIVTVSSL